MNTKFSVLISLYKKEKPLFLRQALKSVFEQTCPPEEVVLVLDGQITPELHSVVNEYENQYANILKIIALKENVGLGNALNEGLKHCSNELVARMDTDDICIFNRFEKQLAVFEHNPTVTAVSSWIDEFVDTPEKVASTRKVPKTNAELVKYAKKRNPLNHPAVMFKKSDVLKVGGYLHFYLLEDYYLWGRLIVRNFELYNIQESLLLFRTSSKMIARRGGWIYAKSEMMLFRKFVDMGLISYPMFLRNILIRIIARLIPNSIRKILYKKFLR